MARAVPEPAHPVYDVVQALHKLPLADQAQFWDALRDHVVGLDSYDPDRDDEAEAAESRQVARRRLTDERDAYEARSVVYYLLFADRIKIGTTTNLTKRLGSVPHDGVLGTEPGGPVVEQARHRQFRGSRITGEWFADTPELREHIATLT